MDDIEIPESVMSIQRRCVIGESSFDNDDMSVVLHFAEMLHRRLKRMAEFYERQSKNFMPGDIRALVMREAAKDMFHVLRDTAKDSQDARTA